MNVMTTARLEAWIGRTESRADVVTAWPAVALAATLDRESATTLTAMRGTLNRADGSLDNTRLLLDPQGPMVSQLQQTVDDLATTAERLRNVAERVDRDPSVLVRGR